MSELERARQRISGKEQEFETIKPQLLQMEAEFMGNLPPQLGTLFQEVQKEIGAAVGVPFDQRIGFCYRFVDEKECPQRFVHEIRNTYDSKHLEWWEVGKPYLKDVVRKLEVNYKGNVEEVFYSQTGYELRRETPEKPLAKSEEHAILSEVIRIHSVQISFYNSDTYNRNERDGQDIWKDWSGILFSITGGSIYFVGPGSGKAGGSFNLDSVADMNLLAEAVARFIDQQAYLNSDLVGRSRPYSSRASSSEASTQNQSASQVDSISSSNRFSGLNEEQLRRIKDEELRQLTEDQYRMMEDEERDRVLYEMERREREIPGYHRPSWIPREEQSRQGSVERAHGGPRTSSIEDRMDQDRFQSGLDRYFSRGPDH